MDAENNHVSSCLICGSTSLQRFTPFDDLKYRVEHCHACKYESIRPLPSIEELLDYYSGYPTTNSSESDVQFLYERTLEFLNFFLGRTNIERSLLPKLNFLEIGFGNAAALLAAAKFGFKAYGLDLDPCSISIANARATAFGLPLECAMGDIHSYRRDVDFHVVKASQIIEHTLDPVAFLRDIYERQPSGGYLIIECPNNEAAFWYVKNELRVRFNRMNFYKSLKVKEHLSGFTAKNLRMLVEKVGYSVVYSRDYSVRDKMFQPENQLWYPTLSAGFMQTLRRGPGQSFRLYPLLKSIIASFDAAASAFAGSGTYLAVWAKK